MLSQWIAQSTKWWSTNNHEIEWRCTPERYKARREVRIYTKTVKSKIVGARERIANLILAREKLDCRLFWCTQTTLVLDCTRKEEQGGYTGLTRQAQAGKLVASVGVSLDSV